jgi:alpha-beta hydrolase superfamily lysophospholipase
VRILRTYKSRYHPTVSFVSLAIVLLVSLALLLALVILAMAMILLRPPRMNDAKAMWELKRLTPTDLGLRYETQTFLVRDERTGRQLKLAAWWIPAPQPMSTDRTVVLVHGYADAKVGAIAWAPMWHALGYHILAVDLRAHGESEGTYSTAGFYERHDFNQVLNQLRSLRPNETRRLVVFGVSLGGAVALAALAEREDDDVDAVVCECPFANYANAAMAHARKMNLPFRSLQPLSVRVAQWISGARFDDVSPAAMIGRIRCPLLVIQACEDVLVPREDVAAVERAVRDRGEPAEFWPVADAGHVLGICADPTTYAMRIHQFLQQSEARRNAYHGFSTRAASARSTAGSARVDNP